MVETLEKVAPKIVEPTIFDVSSPGRTGVTMPASDVPETALPPENLLRPELPLPELAEVGEVFSAEVVQDRAVVLRGRGGVWSTLTRCGQGS